MRASKNCLLANKAGFTKYKVTVASNKSRTDRRTGLSSRFCFSSFLRPAARLPEVQAGFVSSTPVAAAMNPQISACFVSCR